MTADLTELLDEMREPAAASDLPASWQHPTLEVRLLQVVPSAWLRFAHVYLLAMESTLA